MLMPIFFAGMLVVWLLFSDVERWSGSKNRRAFIVAWTIVSLGLMAGAVITAVLG